MSRKEVLSIMADDWEIKLHENGWKLYRQGELLNVGSGGLRRAIECFEDRYDLSVAGVEAYLLNGDGETIEAKDLLKNNE